jgi:hypothetical protein
MITLHVHTSHALQPLDVSYFKPFKTTFQRARDVTMASRNYMEPNKITLAVWVDHVLK